MPTHTRCRICETPLPTPFLDLGAMPLANAFPASPAECAAEATYPLAVAACGTCGLAQLTEVVPAEQLYRQYLYVSSTSEAVPRYAAALAARLVAAHRLGASDLVVELGSNDGLLLRAFQAQGVRVLGVEPARNLAALARARGVPTVEEFFTGGTAARVAAEAGPASLLIGRHVFAHIDDLHDFFVGVSRLLAPDGVLVLEVPYLGTLVESLEFDTIYHEHLSYLALKPVLRLCQRHGCSLVDVEPVSLHGGSLLMTIRRAGPGRQPSARVETLWRQEQAARLTEPATLAALAGRVAQWKATFETLIEQLAGAGAHLAGYGAAAKANTLLNSCPSAARRLACVLDRNPLKQGRYTPGTHRPVVPAERWAENGTSHLVILAWNFKDEIMAQLRPFAERGGRFIIPIPQPEVVGR